MVQNKKKSRHYLLPLLIVGLALVLVQWIVFHHHSQPWILLQDNMRDYESSETMPDALGFNDPKQQQQVDVAEAQQQQQLMAKLLSRIQQSNSDGAERNAKVPSKNEAITSPEMSRKSNVLNHNNSDVIIITSEKQARMNHHDASSVIRSVTAPINATAAAAVGKDNQGATSETNIGNDKTVSSKLRLGADGTAASEVVSTEKGASHPTSAAPLETATTITSIDQENDDSSNCNVTIVTGLYDLGREAFDGRSFATYQEWFGLTLTTAMQPMLVFVPNAALKQYVLDKRASTGNLLLTHVIIEPEYPLQYLTPNVTKILQDPQWIAKMAFPHDLGNRLPQYTLIQHSKFVWLQRAMELDPFKTYQFVWLDAGVSRLWRTNDERGMKPLGIPPQVCANDTFHLSQGGFQLPIHRMVKAWPDDRAIGSTKNFFRGTPWIMRKKRGQQVCQAVLDVYLHEMLGQGRVDNEQITLWVVYRRHPEWFHVWRGQDAQHLPIEDILGNGTGIGFYIAQ